MKHQVHKVSMNANILYQFSKSFVILLLKSSEVNQSLKRVVDSYHQSTNLISWLINVLLFCIIIQSNIFLITTDNSLLVSISCICSFFNWAITLSTIVFDSRAWIKSWVIRLMMWIKQLMKFCVLSHWNSQQLMIFSSFSFKILLLLALLITILKSLFLIT